MRSVRVNTFLQNDSLVVDVWSKIFIVFECIIGIFRGPVIGQIKPLWLILLSVYALIINCTTVAVTVTRIRTPIVKIALYVKTLQYIFCVVLNLLLWKRMRNFYRQLYKLDVKVGCTPKITWGAFSNVTLLIIIIAITSTIFLTHFTILDMMHMAIHLIQAIENHYYGHLVNILVWRLRLINRYIESSFNNVNKCVADGLGNNCGKDAQLTKLLNLYRSLINVYDSLSYAIKWQLLVILITSFTFTLTLSYHVVMGIIWEKLNSFVIMLNMAVVLMEYAPLFAPCVYSDLLRAEVRRLRELLSFKLYEGMLDKSSRSIARRLLSLSETRNLSFSLLRTVDISISLPFKYMGLMITYLIILLQFEKIIYPRT